jgi:hypothetical protein
VLSNPFGYDAADFPQSDYFLSMAGFCHAQLESETLIAEHVESLARAQGTSPLVTRELAMMMAETDGKPIDGEREADLNAIGEFFGKRDIIGVSMLRIQGALGKRPKFKSSMNLRQVGSNGSHRSGDRATLFGRGSFATAQWRKSPVADSAAAMQ